MNRHSPEFKEAAAQIAAGTLSRSAAAERLNVKYQTLCQWLNRSGIYASKEDLLRFEPNKVHYGHLADVPAIDEETAKRLNEALDRVLALEMSALAASKLYNVNCRTLTRKVAFVRQAKGLPNVRVRAKSQPK